MSTEPMQQEGYGFMAAAFEVHIDMGNGSTEDTYQESLELELVERKIPFLPQNGDGSIISKPPGSRSATK